MNISVSLVHILSPQKEERENAEAQLLEYCSADPPAALIELIQTASQESSELSLRQLALLCLRKLVPMYWSAGFASFVGPPGIGEECKNEVRKGLLSLLASKNIDTKVSNSVKYCIVQICAVDFPDEWPGLLGALEDCISKQQSITAADLITELVENVIGSEMFITEQIGGRILNIVLMVLKDFHFGTQLKNSALKLHQQCLLKLNSSTFIFEKNTYVWIGIHFDDINEVLDQLLQQYESDMSCDSLKMKAELFRCLTLLFNFDHNSIQPNESENLRAVVTTQTVSNCSRAYKQALVDCNIELSDLINQCCIEAMEYLQHLSPDLIENFPFSKLIDDLLVLCVLPNDFYENYDFNDFVTKETGLSASYTARDEIGQYLSDCHTHMSQIFVNHLLDKLLQLSSFETPLQEATFYMFQELCSNESKIDIAKYHDLLIIADMVLSTESYPIVIKSKVITLLPKLFENVMEEVPDIKQHVNQFLQKTISCVVANRNEFLLSSMIISFTYYISFAELDSVLYEETANSLQRALLEAIDILYTDCEEDSLGLLLEAMHDLLKTWYAHQDITTKQRELDLLLKVSSQEPSNVRIVVESVRSLPYILKNIHANDYLLLGEMCIPKFVNSMTSFLQNHEHYSPMVVLALEYLTVFMKKPPIEGTLPDSIVTYVLHPLVDFIEKCNDESSVNTALRSLIYLAYNSDQTHWRESIFRVASIILSPENTFFHNMDIGPLLLLTLRSEAGNNNELFQHILKYTSTKLMIHDISTNENYVITFCELLLQDMETCLNLLFEENKNPFQPVAYPCIKQLFTVFKDADNQELIKEVIVALTNLYFTHDARIFELSYANSSDISVLFKDYLCDLFRNQLLSEYSREEEGYTDDNSEEFDDESISEMDDDVYLFTGHQIEYSVKELLEQFFKRAIVEDESISHLFSVAPISQQHLISRAIFDQV